MNQLALPVNFFLLLSVAPSAALRWKLVLFGKLHFVADCPLAFVNTRDPRGQGAYSLRPDGLPTVTNDLTGELQPKFTTELFLINFTMKHNHYLLRINSTLILVRLDGNALAGARIMPRLPFLWIV